MKASLFMLLFTSLAAASPMPVAAKTSPNPSATPNLTGPGIPCGESCIIALRNCQSNQVKFSYDETLSCEAAFDIDR